MKLSNLHNFKKAKKELINMKVDVVIFATLVLFVGSLILVFINHTDFTNLILN